MIDTLPPLDPVPADIEDILRTLLQASPDPAIGDWLQELIQYSGHMSTGDDMRWRLVCMVWLAMQYDVEAGWPYLQWLNMGEETLSGHVSEMLIEGIDNLNAHVQMANWLANADDERLIKFFRGFYPIPAQRKMQPLISRLLARPDQPEIGVWLASYCAGTAHNDGKFMRPWRLLAAAWYAARFNHAAGLDYLKQLTDGAATLPSADNALLMDVAEQTNATTALIQMIADCPDQQVKMMLQNFGHPNLPALAAGILLSEPDYEHLAVGKKQADLDAAIFEQVRARLEQAGVQPGTGTVLNLACGPLAEQTLLLSSAGYNVIGAGTDIPPKYLPTAGAKQWLKRRGHNSAWSDATKPYFAALVGRSGLKLNWKNADIKLADLTRLDEADAAFKAVVCVNYLQHAPNVNSLLSEAARVLTAGGVLVANIRPFTGLTGALQLDLALPWGHLRYSDWFEEVPLLPLNKWREAQYRAALEEYFTVDEWQPENDAQASELLTQEILEELAHYTEGELTRKQIWVVARKKGLYAG
jgi:SAM-dependent methyltransferase